MTNKLPDYLFPAVRSGSEAGADSPQSRHPEAGVDIALNVFEKRAVKGL